MFQLPAFSSAEEELKYNPSTTYHVEWENNPTFLTYSIANFGPQYVFIQDKRAKLKFIQI
jgi:hypothetical protein